MSFDDSLLASLIFGIFTIFVIAVHFKFADRSVRRSIDGDEKNHATTVMLLFRLLLPPLYVCDWWIDIDNLHRPLMAIVSMVMIFLSVICNVHNAYALIDSLLSYRYPYDSQLCKKPRQTVGADWHYIGAITISSVIVVASIIVRNQTSILDPIVRLIHTEFAEIILSLIMTYSICTTILLTYRVKYKPKLTTCHMTAKDWLTNDVRVALVVVIILVTLLFPFTPSILIDLSILSDI